jgi:hypothetical protein
MKTLLAMIGGGVVLAVAGLCGLGFLAGMGAITIPGVTEAGSGTSVKENLIGKWQVESGNLKGSTMLFTPSGATTWILPADIFGLSDCSVNGTYTVTYYKELNGGKRPAGTYIHSTLSSRSGNCNDSFSDLPHNYYDKVDENHILLDEASLVRSN